MTLAEALIKQSYRVVHLKVDEESVIASRLRQLGFVPGVEVKCEAVAPILRNPYLIKVRGINVALARHEALMIGVEQVNA